MEALLDQADALAQSGDEVFPDFTIPEEYAAIDGRQYMTIQDSTDKHGKGWFATRDIPAGTLLIVSKPISMVMDWEDDTDDKDDCPNNNGNTMTDEEEDDDGMDEDEKEPRINEILLLRILEILEVQPDVWTEKLNTLFPRDDNDLNRLPAWVCMNDETFLQIESHLSIIGQNHPHVLPVKEISKRLPLIIRYNILSVETCSELLSYPTTYSNLAGVALYHMPSFFNHSPQPNVSRWAVGDVMGFVTNQNVHAGQELCISYIEHDVLCEPAWRRSQMLSMDFLASDKYRNNLIIKQDQQPANTTNMPDMPVVDSDVQNELMGMDPFERLTAMDELLQQARGQKLPSDLQQQQMSSPTNHQQEGDNNDNNNTESGWFQCDIHNIRILKAITLDGLGQCNDALQLWEECVEFVKNNLPPNDESLVILCIQAALCALHTGQDIKSKQYANIAIQTHHLLFGGGITRFRRRLRNDLYLSLRPTNNNNNNKTESSSQSPVDFLWPLSG